jgi:hypothetical protein
MNKNAGEKKKKLALLNLYIQTKNKQTLVFTKFGCSKLIIKPLKTEKKKKHIKTKTPKKKHTNKHKKKQKNG